VTGPFYSIGPIKNQLLPASNISDFINSVRDVLLLCNWTLTSSFIGTGGTPGYILTSYPTPVGNKFRIKVFYNGDGTFLYPLVKFMVSDSSGASEQIAGYCAISSDHGDKTLRCIAGPHQFFIFIDTSIPPNSYYTGPFSFNNIMAGTPHVRNAVQSEIFWALGDLNHQHTFRENLIGGSNDLYSFLINGIVPNTGAFPDGAGNTANCQPILLSQRSADLVNPVSHFSSYYPVIEPILVMGRVPNNYYATYLWDAVVFCNRISTAFTAIADGGTWETLTLSTDSGVVGSLMLLTTPLQGIGSGGFSY
jgi:hypothetical protein